MSRPPAESIYPLGLVAAVGCLVLTLSLIASMTAPKSLAHGWYETAVPDPIDGSAMWAELESISRGRLMLSYQHGIPPDTVDGAFVTRFRVYISDDMEHWSRVDTRAFATGETFDGGPGVVDVAEHRGRFVAVGYRHLITDEGLQSRRRSWATTFTSDDGETWKQAPHVEDATMEEVMHIGDVFLARGEYLVDRNGMDDFFEHKPMTWTSRDGITWRPDPQAQQAPFAKRFAPQRSAPLRWRGRTWWIGDVDASNVEALSTRAGTDWKLSRVGTRPVPYDAGQPWVSAGTPAKIVGIRQTVGRADKVVHEAWTSTDGTSWRRCHSALTSVNPPVGMTTTDDRFVLVGHTTPTPGSPPAIWTSTDACRWKQVADALPLQAKSFYAVGRHRGALVILGGTRHGASTYNRPNHLKVWVRRD